MTDMVTKQLIEELYLCAAKCRRCYEACTEEADNQHLQKCINITRDCEQMCETTAQIVERNSEFQDKFLKWCAEICELCAEECSQHPHVHCTVCAQACKNCAEACISQLAMQ